MTAINSNRSHHENPVEWERTRSRSSSEVLAILAPTADEPKAIQRAGVWKTGTLAVPEAGGAA